MAESDKAIRRIRAATKRHFTSEEKIRIVLEGLRGEIPISDLCRREGVSAATYYKWSKDFLDAGKNGLTLETGIDPFAMRFDLVRGVGLAVDSDIVFG